MQTETSWLGRLAELEALFGQILAEPAFREVAAIADSLGLGASELREIAKQTAKVGLPAERWEPFAQACQQRGIPETGYIPQRYLLLRAGLENLHSIPAIPFPIEVKGRLAGQFHYVCSPDQQMTELLNPRHYGFRVMCKFMLLQRFPAGQSDIEVAGFPRSWCLKVRARHMMPLAWCLLRSGGFAPFFESHTAYRRDLPILTEEGEREVFRCIGIALRLQPEIKGYLGMSWFMDPTLGTVSPHLSWLPALYREYEQFGAVWTDIGPAPPGGGYMTGDRRRRRLYESGQWKPVNGLLLWNRKDLLRWHTARYGASAPGGPVSL